MSQYISYYTEAVVGGDVEFTEPWGDAPEGSTQRDVTVQYWPFAETYVSGLEGDPNEYIDSWECRLGRVSDTRFIAVSVRALYSGNMGRDLVIEEWEVQDNGSPRRLTQTITTAGGYHDDGLSYPTGVHVLDEDHIIWVGRGYLERDFNSTFGWIAVLLQRSPGGWVTRDRVFIQHDTPFDSGIRVEEANLYSRRSRSDGCVLTFAEYGPGYDAVAAVLIRRSGSSLALDYRRPMNFNASADTRRYFTHTAAAPVTLADGSEEIMVIWTEGGTTGGSNLDRADVRAARLRPDGGTTINPVTLHAPIARFGTSQTGLGGGYDRAVTLSTGKVLYTTTWRNVNDEPLAYTLAHTYITPDLAVSPLVPVFHHFQINTFGFHVVACLGSDRAVAVGIEPTPDSGVSNGYRLFELAEGYVGDHGRWRVGPLQMWYWTVGLLSMSPGVGVFGPSAITFDSSNPNSWPDTGPGWWHERPFGLTLPVSDEPLLPPEEMFGRPRSLEAFFRNIHQQG